jgi:outer membrane protein
MRKILCPLTVAILLATSAAAQSLPFAPNPAAPDTPAIMPSAVAASTDTTLTRQQAEQIALKANPHISVGRLLALAQKEVVVETRSAELPSVFGNITGVEAEEGSRLSSGSLTASRLITHVGAGVTFTQLITDFGHTRNLVASSSLQAKAAEQNASATEQDIVLATDIAFFDALEAQATLTVAHITVEARRAVTDQVNALTASKLKSTLDQSFAQVNLSQAQLLVLDSENQAASAMDRLNDVLGSNQDTQYRLLDDAQSLDTLPVSAESVIALAMQQRPDLRAQQLTHEADVKFSRAQHEQLLPTVSALGAAGYTPLGSSTYFNPDWYGAVGGNLSMPLFNGFKFHAEAKEADIRARVSDENTRALADRIVRDVRLAWLRANTAQQRVAVTHQLLQQANTALDLAQTRYNLGLSSIVELSQAQLQQTQAEIDEANARFEFKADLATLRFQSGVQP